MMGAWRAALVGMTVGSGALHACSSDYITNDGGVDATNAEASTDAACVPVDVAAPPVHGGAACLIDASVCNPGNETAFLPAALPPPVSATPYPGLCTTQQISSFYNDCIGTTASSAACNAFVAASQTCFGCLFTPSTASKWGALVGVNGTFSYLVNNSACIELIEPCNQECANAVADLLECEIDACTSGVGCQDAGSSVLACVDEATTCTACSGYAATVAACGAALVGHPAASACGFGASQQAQLQAIATVLCGPSP
jgi:hypothetical protein